MQLCLLSVAYACPYHNPTAPWGTLFTMLISANCSPSQGHTRHLPSYSCNRDYSIKTRLLQHASSENLPTEVGYDAEMLSGLDPGEDNEHADELEAVSDSFCRNSLVVQTHIFISCPGGWSHTIPQVKKLDVRPVGCTATFSKPTWRQLMVDKLTLNSLGTALVDIPAVSMTISHSLKTCDICGIVLCDKMTHFRVAFYCP